MTKSIKTQVLVVGGGPGGYVAAIRAGQLGLKTTLVEADKLGGTCLIRGCIPSKALIHVASKFEDLAKHAGEGAMGIRLPQAAEFDLAGAVDWKDSIVQRLNTGVAALLKKAKVEVVHGWASFEDAKHCLVETADELLKIQAEHVILANGSVSAELPHLPLGEKIISSTEALDLQDLPKRLVVVGAGYIGLEMGIAFAKMGSEVSFVEAADRILPLYDTELTKPLENWLKTHKVPIHLNCKAQALSSDGLDVEHADGRVENLPADKILVTVGRKANTHGWGLDNMHLDMNGAFVKVDAQCRTSMRDVYAIGDLVGEPMLAHKASAQGEMVAEIIAGQKRAFEPRAIPAVCFTEPELVGVGLTPDEAKAAGYEIKVGKFPFAANGRSLAAEAGQDGGFVRVTARADNHLVLGIHAVGKHVAELSGEFVHALEMGARLEDIAGTIHVHPTMTEALPEAALSALGHAIHF